MSQVFIKSKSEIINLYDDLISNVNTREVLIEGEGKVLLSCPHCVEHFRNGEPKAREPETVVIAYFINKNLNYPYIYKVKSDMEDANFDKVSKYKDAVVQYIKENDIKLFVDFHQLDGKRIENINLGIAHGNNMSDKRIVDQFVKSFSENNIEHVTIDMPFSASGENVLSTYVHNNTNIDTIQIEINSSLVYDNVDGFNNTLDALIKTFYNLKEKNIC